MLGAWHHLIGAGQLEQRRQHTQQVRHGVSAAMLRKLDQVADRLHKLRGHVCQALRGRLQTAACSVVSSWRHARSGVSMGAERAPRQQQRATRRPARSARPARRSVPWRRIQRELDLTAQSGGGRNACISSRGRAQAPGQAVPGSALIDQQRPRDQHQLQQQADRSPTRSNDPNFDLIDLIL